MSRKISKLKDHVVTIRLSEDEYNFIQSQVDCFFYHNASSYIRSLIREASLSELDELQRMKLLKEIGDRVNDLDQDFSEEDFDICMEQLRSLSSGKFCSSR